MKTAATVQMLNLKLPTDPRWVNLAEMDLEEILTDHAYCEQKATTSCISLIIGYPDYPEIIAAVAPIVTEEWERPGTGIAGEAATLCPHRGAQLRAVPAAEFVLR
jgi:tRNA isopentenyl-2-thiomethyl-A-37 hydroxylase MiaE